MHEYRFPKRVPALAATCLYLAAHGKQTGSFPRLLFFPLFSTLRKTNVAETGLRSWILTKPFVGSKV